MLQVAQHILNLFLDSLIDFLGSSHVYCPFDLWSVLFGFLDRKKQCDNKNCYFCGMTTGNGNKDGLYSVLLRDYKSHAAATCMNRLAKLRCVC